MHGVSDLVVLTAPSVKEALLAHVETYALEAAVPQTYYGVRLADVALHLHMCNNGVNEIFY